MATINCTIKIPTLDTLAMLKDLEQEVLIPDIIKSAEKAVERASKLMPVYTGVARGAFTNDIEFDELKGRGISSASIVPVPGAWRGKGPKTWEEGRDLSSMQIVEVIPGKFTITILSEIPWFNYQDNKHRVRKYLQAYFETELTRNFITDRRLTDLSRYLKTT